MKLYFCDGKFVKWGQAGDRKEKMILFKRFVLTHRRVYTKPRINFIASSKKA